MLKIGLDISLNSTGVCINKDMNFKLFNFTNKKLNYKWFKETSHLIKYYHHDTLIDDNYSDNESVKLKRYDEISNNIIEILKKEIEHEECKIFIEGYSYNSTAGRLIDIVTFSTLVRIELINNNFNINIISPSTLKKFAGDKVYPIIKGVSRNENNLPSGSFKKPDILECILKMDDVKGDYVDYLRKNKDILLKPKDLVKPFDDINDSLILSLMN